MKKKLIILALTFATFTGGSSQDRPMIQNQGMLIDKTELSLKQRITRAHKILVEMDTHARNEMFALFPDLNEIRQVTKAESLMNMGPETWYYTAEGKFTVVICENLNLPVYIFNSTTPSDKQIAEAKNALR